ncbi:dihydrolipoamide acetyltransferase family protein [Arthrobacter sp. B1805]|uniref:dihydrolipoamide acetyltransferase family protein n=1 Tax=Arthrobacter sp. B1805 TaxID=2058892 RepID=UPI002157EE1D|nr:dihydrolipoamide acetyltransferase family protein [Arthrobacter sp. B1805]
MTTPTVAPQLLVFALPDLGEGLTEAELVTWLVAEGDAVAVDQPIAEVETAKSVVEVPSPFAGTVAVLHGRPGEVLDVGAPFLSVRPEGARNPVAAPPDEVADSRGAASAREDAGVPIEATRDIDEAEGVATGGSGNVLIGYGTPGGGMTGRKRPRKGAPKRTATSAGPTVATNAVPQDSPRRAGLAPICVSPLVRKLARDHHVRLDAVRGSGQAGLILRRDIEQAIAALSAGQTDQRAAAADGSASMTDQRAAATDGSVSPDAVASRDSRSGLAVLERTPLRGVRRTIADAMSRSRREIPEATVWVDVDATALVELREGMKRRTPDAVPGILAFVARFVVAGLARYPELNSRITTGDDGTQEIVRVDGVNLGIATQTDRGLVVPGIRRADTLSARGLDAEIRRLAVLAREGKATPSDLSSGTFTLNNYGVFGVDGSAAIINYPESAILGMGRIIDRPWVVDGQLAVRKVTELTLAFDHRVCDGGTAGGFLRFVADAMENPGGLLADL